MKSFKNKLWGSPSRKELTDLIDISIYKEAVGEKGAIVKTVLATGCGSWLSFVEFEGETFWSIEQKYPEWQVPSGLHGQDKMLQSDSSTRMDYNLIKIKMFDDAEKFKHEMEEAQRADKKLRSEAQKKRNALLKK